MLFEQAKRCVFEDGVVPAVAGGHAVLYDGYGAVRHGLVQSVALGVFADGMKSEVTVFQRVIILQTTVLTFIWQPAANQSTFNCRKSSDVTLRKGTVHTGETHSFLGLT